MDYSRASGLDPQPDWQQTTDDGATVLIAEVKHFSDSTHRLLRAEFEAMGYWLSQCATVSPASGDYGAGAPVLVRLDPRKCQAYLAAMQRILDVRGSHPSFIKQLVDSLTSRLLRDFRCYLITLAGKGMRLLRDQALAKVTPTRLAADALSCQRAEREAAIHPAFAPPNVVI
ncbi:hypothetical protein [Cupriavidus alkaliphilus]|uniref:hypothetical protein n=1 Tax=Cupriavidus alkaliphilus TaxID=942866 RepID=UPI00339D5190